MSKNTTETSQAHDTSPIAVKIYGVDLTVSRDLPWMDRFWKMTQSGDWEDDTLRFIVDHVTPQTTVLDIGAWIGPITMLASKLGHHVYSVEPDPVARKTLVKNVALNNIVNNTIFDKAISEEAGELKLYSPKIMGDSQTSALAPNDGESVSVPTMSLADLSKWAPEDKPLVVKIDIEGFEFPLAPAIYRLMEDRKPFLHISLHPKILAKSLAPERGKIAARFAALRQTLAIIRTLKQYGTMHLDEHSNILPISWSVFSLIMTPWRKPINFSLSIIPQE